MQGPPDNHIITAMPEVRSIPPGSSDRDSTVEVFSATQLELQIFVSTALWGSADRFWCGPVLIECRVMVLESSSVASR